MSFLVLSVVVMDASSHPFEKGGSHARKWQGLAFSKGSFMHTALKISDKMRYISRFQNQNKAD